MLMAGLWWGLFTLIPVLGMWQMRGVERPVVAAKAGVVGGTFRQLKDTFRHLLGLRQTLLFLVAYMFFNDGIQTVIGQSSLYGTAELGFSETTMLTLFLMVQFVAFGGALIFGQVARRLGAWRTVLAGIGHVGPRHRRGLLRPGEGARAPSSRWASASASSWAAPRP